MPDSKIREKWNKEAATKLLGRKIIAAQYMDAAVAQDAFGWSNCPVVLTLDDNTQLIPSADDEGNDGGVLFQFRLNGRQLEGFPVLR